MHQGPSSTYYFVSRPPLIHARMGSDPNSDWSRNSLSLARPYRKHAGHAHPHRHRHRLHVRDCQSLGRSLDTFSTNCARIIGLGTFRRRFAFLVAAIRLVSARFPSYSSRPSASPDSGAAWIRGGWGDNDSARTKRSAMDAGDEGTRSASGSASGRVARGAEGLGWAVMDTRRWTGLFYCPDS